MKKVFFRESRQFITLHKHVTNQPLRKKHSQPQLLDFVLKNSRKNDTIDVLNKIDEFCRSTWMMNIGPEKGEIIKRVGIKNTTNKILQLGGYCGYSALFFANCLKQKKEGRVFTVQINQQFAEIAHKIHQHAGLADKITIKIGTVANSLQFLKQKSPFDLILIDHQKTEYLSDFLLLQQNQIIKKQTIIAADNIINPGAPQYLSYMKQKQDFSSTLFYCHREHTNQQDAILISEKL